MAPLLYQFHGTLIAIVAGIGALVLYGLFRASRRKD